MHKYNRLFFSVLIFLAACGGDKVPRGILGQNEMTNLLTDIHIVDGSMYNVLQLPDSLYKYGTDKYLVVFKNHHTDSAQFRESFRYYSANPEKMEVMYEQVMKNVKQKADSLNKLNLATIAKDSKRRTDSLKKLGKQAKPQPPRVAEPPEPAKLGPNRHLTPVTKPRKRTHVDSLK